MKMILITIPILLVAQAQMRGDRIAIAPPHKVAALDMGKLKGEPSRLAWSPDGTQLYVQTLERAGADQPGRQRHYVFATPGGAKQDLEAEPGWAIEYWAAKSGQTPPDARVPKIEVRTEQRQEHTTSSPMGGDLARGATTSGDTGTSSGDVGSAAYNAQTATVHSMVLNGQTIGEFVSTVIVPGMTFGWGPRGTGVIAFASPKGGRVVVMDHQGATRDVGGSKDAVLPAWSPDGARLAWLQKDGRKKFGLMVANVTSR